MSLKKTIILACVLVLIIGYGFYKGQTRKVMSEPDAPDVWSLDQDTISRIHIRLVKTNKEISFLKTDAGEWKIDDKEEIPVAAKRWGGIVLLLSGPQAKRFISDKEEDAARYGFPDPRMVVTLTADGPDSALTIVVGDMTPDEKSIYTMLKPFQTVYLLDRTWYDTIERLVLDPPRQMVRSILPEK